MFHQPVVFVVGAGASKEFGLPTGGEMKEKIASTLNFNRRANGLLIGNRTLFDMFGSRFGQDSGQRQEEATELAARVNEFVSIDEALHWFSGRPTIVKIGKAAIVWEILQSERASALFNSQNPEMIPDRPYTTTWTLHFLLISEMKREQAKDLFRNVTVINFNYDRTIEHFIYSRLQSNFGLNSTEAKEVLASLNMIRPYGSVGPLSWQDENGISFGHDIGPDHEVLFTLAENVRTYTEQQPSGAFKAAIKNSMDSARLVVFLGFGFHFQNMTILQATGTTAPWRRAIGTVQGIDLKNWETIQFTIARTIGSNEPRGVQLLDRDAYNLLTTQRLSIMTVI